MSLMQSFFLESQSVNQGFVMNTRIEVVKKKKLKSPVLITGLPGIGLVGKIAVDYLLTQFKLEKLANIYSDSFPPSVHTEKGVLELIRDELFLYEFKNRSFLFLAGPVQPSLDIRMALPRDHYEFAEKIVLFAKKLGVKKIYTIAGINVGDKRMERAPRAVVAATDKKILEEFKALDARVDYRGGLISGAAGLLLGIGKAHGISGACIMGETNAKLIYGDHGAAKRVLELLVKKFGFRVNMKNIEKEAHNIEDAFSQLSKQLEEKKEEDEEDSDLSYVR